MDSNRRRPITWPDVGMLAVVTLLVLGLSAVGLICMGRWPG